MTIRTRLIVHTALLQVASLLMLSWGVIAVQRKLGQREVARSENLIKYAVARTATDALIQKDEVQLISYLNFLKVQHPALVYARVIWRDGKRTFTQNLGKPDAMGGRVQERRVVVSDPTSASRTVEILFGVDSVVLQAPVIESLRRMVKILALVGLLTALAGWALVMWLSRLITRPLAALGALAEQISAGRLGVNLEWQSPDEIGALVRVFNSMSARLADLDVAKKNFVSSVTHELRSPLGAIESFLPLMRDKMRSGDEAALAQSILYLDRIEVNVRRLNGFITDLLDVAKIEQGKMECVIRPMPLEPLISEVALFLEAKAGAQGVTIENRVSGSPTVLGDSDRVRQVLVNLLSNALKFTPSGGRIWVSTDSFREGSQRWLDVAVGDTGRGMDEADLRRLFQPFSQGHNITLRTSATSRGTGLGLYIVKSIVDQHGGKVSVKSALGKGTEISFSLKVAN